jgi:hypothetical protein
MAQTAVEWLFKALWEEPKDKMVWYAILDKAKEMEKEQIMDAYNNGEDRSAELYYNETYGENRGSNQSITGKD